MKSGAAENIYRVMGVDTRRYCTVAGCSTVETRNRERCIAGLDTPGNWSGEKRSHDGSFRIYKQVSHVCRGRSRP